MDFIFALFPWFITYRLNLKRGREGCALCDVESWYGVSTYNATPNYLLYPAQVD